MTMSGSLEGLFADGVQTQNRAFPMYTLRQPAQKSFTSNSLMGRSDTFTLSPSSIARVSPATKARRINHLPIDIIMNSQMILISLLQLALVAAQISHDPIIPDVEKVRFTPEIKTVPSNTAFKTIFPGLGYQIGGTVYQTHNGLLSQELYNRSFYNQSTSCHLYKSQLTLNIIQDATLASSQTIQSMAVSDTLGALFALISDDSYSDQQISTRTLIAYDFNKTSLTRRVQNITLQELGLNTSESLDIMLNIVGNQVIATDGIKLVAINSTNFSKHWEIPIDLKNSTKYDYEFASQNDLLKFDVCHYDSVKGQGTILAAWDTALRVYNLTNFGAKATLSLDLQPPANSYFTDVVADHEKYWALAQGKFVAFRPTKNGNYSVSIVNLQSSDCFTLNKYQTTVHIICKESGLNYVAQYFLNQSFINSSEALRLNRYYNEIDDARLLFRFGGDYNPKLIISGDDEILMVPYAVNRMALQSDRPPRGQRIRSVGLELIYSLSLFSNFTHNYALGVAEGYTALLVVVEEPPEMECMVTRTSEDIRWNILVELNTSSCLANGDWQQLQSICSYQIPFSLYASLIEVDATNHTTIVATVLLLLLALAILIVGCGLYCKTALQKAGAKIRQKLTALRKQKRMKPI